MSFGGNFTRTLLICAVATFTSLSRAAIIDRQLFSFGEDEATCNALARDLRALDTRDLRVSAECLRGPAPRSEFEVRAEVDQLFRSSGLALHRKVGALACERIKERYSLVKFTNSRFSVNCLGEIARIALVPPNQQSGNAPAVIPIDFADEALSYNSCHQLRLACDNNCISSGMKLWLSCRGRSAQRLTGYLGDIDNYSAQWPDLGVWAIIHFPSAALCQFAELQFKSARVDGRTISVSCDTRLSSLNIKIK